MRHIAIMLLIAGCTPAFPEKKPTDNAPAVVAVATAEYVVQQSGPVLPESPPKANSPPSEPDSRPAISVPESEPTPAVPIAPRETRLIMLTAAWCGVCNGPQQDVLDSLSEAGWQVGSTPDAHIQKLNVDSSEGRAWLQQQRIGYQSLPKFILFDKGRAVVSGEGLHSADAINRLRHWQPTAPVQQRFQQRRAR